MRTSAMIKQELLKFANPRKAQYMRGFFQTRRGEYGEGDKFLGVIVPHLRTVAKKYYADITFTEVSVLLQSAYHELRHTGLIILTMKLEKEQDEKKQVNVVKCLLRHIDYVNNWDLVDTAAPGILGRYLLNRDKILLYEYAATGNLWKQRMAIVTTLYFVRLGKLEDGLAIAEMLVDHPHDLIHKSVGWVLREVGKKDLDAELQFLDRYHTVMPRTMLRYAIERFSPEEKEKYMVKDEE